ncbi:MAG: helix-turn-helix domain-containing protein [Acidimicrobiia bacterium]
MRRTRFDESVCPIARTTDLVGDWWTPLVMREACSGVRRFEVFREHLGIPRASLAARLDRLVEEGLLRRAPYQERPLREEYRLTRKGAEFYAVLAAMFRWGRDWMFEEGQEPGAVPELMIVDVETGDEIRPLVVDERTGAPVDVRRTRLRIRSRPQS